MEDKEMKLMEGRERGRELLITTKRDVDVDVDADADVDDKWVHDSSLDHHGNVPLRASTGVWKASLFIIAIEFAERLSYFGISTSLIIYMTKVIHQDLKAAAKSVNYWAGVTTMMPLLGGFLADAYFGRFPTVIASSLLYILGLLLLTMAEVVPSLKACDADICHEPRRAHVVVFFLGIYLISIGTGGHKPSLESFGADQFDDDHPQERKKKMSFFNWWNFALCSGLLLGVTVIVYVQEHVSWGVADIVLTIVMTGSIVIFYIGWPFYRYRNAPGSPFTPMLQVIIAAIVKRSLPYPASPCDLYEVPKTIKLKKRFLCHTERLRFLDKAAIPEDNEDMENNVRNPWRLSTITQVEELKLIINMIPIWLTALPFGICVSQASTFFIKQGTTLDRNIFHGSFLIPPASIYGLAAIGMIISVTLYEKILTPLSRRLTGHDRGIKILQRIGFGMIFSIISMAVAAIVERKRLDLVEKNPLEGSKSMSVFWLAPQFFILGFGDGFTLVGLQEYFYDQVPDSMRSLGIALYLSVIGAANFLSNVLITIVDHASKNCGEKKSWFGKDLNGSRLDNFYWFLAAMNAVNLGIYIFVARRYSYKNVEKKAAVGAVSHI